MAKRYYWLKMHEDFFKSKDIKKLRKISGGDTFAIIYLKMMLLSLKTDGVIAYESVEPTFAEELALELDEDAINVNATLLFLENMNLIEEQEGDTFRLNHAHQLIGSETPQAGYNRKRRSEENQRLTAENVTQLPPVTKALQQRESEREEIRDRAIVKRYKKDKEIHHKHGEYNHVLLTDSQLSKLKTDFTDWADKIKNLDEYIEMKGTKYKNHNLTIRKWAKNQNGVTPKTANHEMQKDHEGLGW